MCNITKFGYLPTILRTDNGTETGLMEDFQKALRYYHPDANSGEKSFLKGKSTHNQRIEAYWRQFRRHMAEFYISFFKTMENEGLLDTSNPIHIDILRYCFRELIKEDIAITRREWNEHRVRKQIGRCVQGGIPNELYHNPRKWNAEECRKPVNHDHIDLLLQKYTKQPQLYRKQINELVLLLIPSHRTPSTAEDAYNLYIDLISKIEGNLKCTL